MDLVEDSEAREYWVRFFLRHIETLLGLGVDASIRRGEGLHDARRRAEGCRLAFAERFEGFLGSPQASGDRVTILTLDAWRDEILRRHGFVDCMIDLKSRENDKTLPLLAEVCAEVDRHSGIDQLLAIVQGVFAGNLFDMGAKASAEKFIDGRGPSFFETRSSLRPRPWLIDDFDRLASRWLDRSPDKMVYFIDNAGSDFLLGALVMMRWFAQRGTEVVMAANERPTLNDMTVHDVRAIWPRVLEVMPEFASLPIRIVSTGTGEPLIDLLGVSDELNVASVGADLVVLEGMGRGVESNLNARFKCDALNLAMIKDELIARRCGGVVFDCVCRFR